MKKTVLVYGIIAGIIASILMAIGMLTTSPQNMENSMYLGFASIILSAVVIGFGMANHKKNIGGAISFGKAFLTGLWIALIASSMYVATWMIMYSTTFKDFGKTYTEYSIQSARKAGKSEEEIKVLTDEMTGKMELYDSSPLYRAATTYTEILPIQLVIVLIAAAIISRKKKTPQTT